MCPANLKLCPAILLTEVGMYGNSAYNEVKSWSQGLRYTLLNLNLLHMYTHTVNSRYIEVEGTGIIRSI